MKLYLLALPLFALTTVAAANEVDTAVETAEVSAPLTLDSSIEALMANPAAKAVVDAQIPGIESHSAYGQFKSMSLRAVQPFSGGMITDDMLTAIEAGLAALAEPAAE